MSTGTKCHTSLMAVQKFSTPLLSRKTQHRGPILEENVQLFKYFPSHSLQT